jgi:hypothetical protein
LSVVRLLRWPKAATSSTTAAAAAAGSAELTALVHSRVFDKPRGIRSASAAKLSRVLRTSDNNSLFHAQQLTTVAV